jgi:hypothetical protein
MAYKFYDENRDASPTKDPVLERERSLWFEGDQETMRIAHAAVL